MRVIIERHSTDKILRAIDDIYTSLQINGKESDLTDKLVNYLTANVDDIAECIEDEDEDLEENL